MKDIKTQFKNLSITMSQILDPLPSNQQGKLLCYYMNATSHIQIIRITSNKNWYFERVIFPWQRLVFEALTHAQLEIHTGMKASTILLDTIPCDRLCISDSLDDDDWDEDINPLPEIHGVAVKNNAVAEAMP
jgi:hypothetical protein